MDNFSDFQARKAALTYIDEFPAGALSLPSAIQGVKPIGNVHPNAEGYGVIAGQVAAAAGSPTAVPEPSALALLGTGIAFALGTACRRGRIPA